MNNNFGKNLKTLRKIKNISQSQLAKELKVTQATISLWEREKREPSLSYLIAIANYFDITLAKLVISKLETTSLK